MRAQGGRELDQLRKAKGHPIFRKIFTPEVPLTNLFLIPKITAADRWWFQPFNTIFNLTPHRTVVEFETMNYYETSEAHPFPTQDTASCSAATPPMI